jgi:nucleoside-triphosphatase THEP1
MVTGETGSGKTTLCRRVWEIARRRGMNTGGLLCPAVFEKDRKTGISVLDLKSAESRLLAVLRESEYRETETGRWSFFTESLQWGDQKLKSALPCTLLIVDELGPLEFDQNKGFLSGVAAIDSGEYRAAIVVIRPALVVCAQKRWPQALLWQVDAATTGHSSARSLYDHLFGSPNEYTSTS